MSKTSISVQSETRDRLRAHKRGGESYDDVLRRLLAESDQEVAQA